MGNACSARNEEFLLFIYFIQSCCGRTMTAGPWNATPQCRYKASQFNIILSQFFSYEANLGRTQCMSREHEHMLVGNKEIKVIKQSSFYCLLHPNEGNLSLLFSIILIPHTRLNRLYAKTASASFAQTRHCKRRHWFAGVCADRTVKFCQNKCHRNTKRQMWRVTNNFSILFSLIFTSVYPSNEWACKVYRSGEEKNTNRFGRKGISEIEWIAFDWVNEMANKSVKESSLEPNERMRNLTKFGNTVDVDPNVPIKR